MDSSDYSHLYHDSHFNTGVLEAREHLKARDNNAREQRLLRQQDKQLQQAKNTWHRRHSWQQDLVRKDLWAILERTPTFDRSLRDERRRLSLGNERNAFPFSSKQNHSLPSVKAVTSSRAAAASLTPLCRTSPNRPKRQLSPVTLERQMVTDMSQKGAVTIPGRINKLEKQGARKVQFPDQEADRAFQTLTLASPRHRHSLSGPLPDISPTSADKKPEKLTVEQRKGARLRRRGHNALMALVRVKVRHDQRKFHVLVPEVGESSGDGEVLSEDDPGPSHTPSSTQSWLSLPVAAADVGDRDDGDEVFGEASARPRRPRFFSVD